MVPILDPFNLPDKAVESIAFHLPVRRLLARNAQASTQTGWQNNPDQNPKLRQRNRWRFFFPS